MAEIDLDDISAKIRRHSAKGGMPVMAVVKGRCYGMAAIPGGKAIWKTNAPFRSQLLQEPWRLRRAGCATDLIWAIPPSALSHSRREEIRPQFPFMGTLLPFEAAVREAKPPGFHFALEPVVAASGSGHRESAEAAPGSPLAGLEAEGCSSTSPLRLRRPDPGQTAASGLDAFAHAEGRGVNIPIRNLRQLRD